MENSFLEFTPLLVSLLLYVYFSYCLMVIAQRTNVDTPWLAWVPIVNIYTLLMAAGRPAWWLILFLIPIVNLIVIVVTWMDIAGRLGKKKWIGILIIIPVIQLIVPGYLAFSD